MLFFAFEVDVHLSCIGDRFQGNIERSHIADKVSRNAILPRRFLHDVMVYETFTFRNISPLFGVCPSLACSSNATFRKLALLRPSGEGNELCWTPFESDDGIRVGFRDGMLQLYFDDG